LTVIYALGAVAGMIISYGLVIVRFYKNLFTSEGYFTFSIPVSPVQHIWCKLICGMAMILASTVVVIISLIINFVFTEIGSSISSSIGSLFETIELIDFAHLMGYMVEFSIVGILSVCAALLQVYCAISFGQGFKNKIGGSVVSYLVINVILNAVSSFLSVFFMLGPQLFLEIFNEVPGEFIVHMIMIFAIIIEIALCAGFFVITAYKTTKKLNLE
ncbi:MAG: hypothetical protein IKT32_04905, partial [Clostridia bacterium]|nr:hypothetical protein [Clostridia bacterium]